MLIVYVTIGINNKRSFFEQRPPSGRLRQWEARVADQLSLTSPLARPITARRHSHAAQILLIHSARGSLYECGRVADSVPFIHQIYYLMKGKIHCISLKRW